MVSILSWNLDGLDEEELEARTEAVIGIVLQGNYDVVFFQELVPSTFIKYCDSLSEKYKVISGFAGCGYFIATLLRKAPSIRYLDHYIHPFPNTTMGRNLLVTKVSIGNLKLALLNTHLESMLPSSEERKAQLKTCFEIALNFPPDFNVFFGGDMNLRDWEATGLIPENMPDLWVQNGSWLSTKYTWDLTENTNKQMPSDRQPRCRFDRFYMRDSVPKALELRYFGLEGEDEVGETEMFPSDHWAVSIRFSKVRVATAPSKARLESETSSNWRA